LLGSCSTPGGLGGGASIPSGHSTWGAGSAGAGGASAAGGGGGCSEGGGSTGAAGLIEGRVSRLVSPLAAAAGGAATISAVSPRFRPTSTRAVSSDQIQSSGRKGSSR